MLDLRQGPVQPFAQLAEGGIAHPVELPTAPIQSGQFAKGLAGSCEWLDFKKGYGARRFPGKNP